MYYAVHRSVYVSSQNILSNSLKFLYDLILIYVINFTSKYNLCLYDIKIKWNVFHIFTAFLKNYIRDHWSNSLNLFLYHTQRYSPNITQIFYWPCRIGNFQVHAVEAVLYIAKNIKKYMCIWGKDGLAFSGQVVSTYSSNVGDLGVQMSNCISDILASSLWYSSVPLLILIYYSYNDYFDSSNFTVTNDIRCMNNLPERMWKYLKTIKMYLGPVE